MEERRGARMGRAEGRAAAAAAAALAAAAAATAAAAAAVSAADKHHHGTHNICWTPDKINRCPDKPRMPICGPRQAPDVIALRMPSSSPDKSRPTPDNALICPEKCCLCPDTLQGNTYHPHPPYKAYTPNSSRPAPSPVLHSGPDKNNTPTNNSHCLPDKNARRQTIPTNILCFYVLPRHNMRVQTNAMVAQTNLILGQTIPVRASTDSKQVPQPARVFSATRHMPRPIAPLNAPRATGAIHKPRQTNQSPNIVL